MRDQRRGIGNGILLITLGLLFMIDRQGYADFGRLWPVILIVLGTIRLLFPREVKVCVTTDTGAVVCRQRRSFGGFWLLLVGVLFLLHENHVLSIDRSWPLFIVAGGLALIFGGVMRRSMSSSDEPQSGGPLS